MASQVRFCITRTLFFCLLPPQHTDEGTYSDRKETGVCVSNADGSERGAVTGREGDGTLQIIVKRTKTQ